MRISCEKRRFSRLFAGSYWILESFFFRRFFAFFQQKKSCSLLYILSRPSIHLVSSFPKNKKKLFEKNRLHIYLPTYEKLRFQLEIQIFMLIEITFHTIHMLRIKSMFLKINRNELTLETREHDS